MRRPTFSLLVLILSTTAVAVPPAATTRPAATQSTSRPVTALNAEIQRAVELAQQAVRAPKPPLPRPPRNTLQKRDRVDLPAHDPLPPIAGQLVGKSGSVGFRVVD